MEMGEKIDLGTKSSPLEAPTPVNDSVERVHYPSIYISGETELDLPEEGFARVEFKRVRCSESKDENGKMHYTCDLEIRSIQPCEGEEEEEEDEDEAPTKSGSEAASALDSLLKEYLKSKDE